MLLSKKYPEYLLVREMVNLHCPCLLVSKEYEVSDHPKVVSIKEPSKRESEDVEDVGKKRVAHPSAATSVTRHVGPSQPPKKHINPQQKMYERWRLMREAAAEKAAEKAAADTKIQITSASAVQSASNIQKEHIESASSISNSYLQLNGSGNGKSDICICGLN